MSEAEKSRIQTLRERVKSAERSPGRATHDVPFRGGDRTLTKIQVKSDFPMYRIQSGRTRRAQSEYLERRSDLPSDFFDDPEDPRVQTAQHEILLRLIQERGLDEDLRDRGQRSPVVLTYDGFVVDGNRRVAALREDGIEYIWAVVLPEDADRNEIYQTELELQMARETKAEYNWVDELLHIRYGFDELGETVESIARRMRLDGKEIDDKLATLRMVDVYLEWLGEPGQYHKIPEEKKGTKMKQAFIEVTTRLSGKVTANLPEPARVAIRQACFAAILKKEGYINIRNIISQMSSKPASLLEKLRADEELSSDPELNLEEEPADEKREEQPTAVDPLSSLADDETEDTPREISILSSLFSRPESAEKAVPALIRATDELVEEEREEKRELRPVIEIEKAERLLKKVDLTPETKSINKAAEALVRIDEQVERLAGQIEDVARKRR